MKNLMIAAMGLLALNLPGIAGAQAAASIDHIAINVTDQPRSIAFYHDAFGLNEITAPFGGVPGSPRWMRTANGIELHLQAIRTPFTAPPRFIHFALSVPDLDKVIAYLDARHHPWGNYLGETGKINRTRKDNVRQIFVQDPDGYWIEVNDTRRAN